MTAPPQPPHPSLNMNSQTHLLPWLAGSLMLSILPAHGAVIVDLGPGLSSPPVALGGYALTPFPDDPRDNFTQVASVPSPLGGTVEFSPDVSLRELGDGWDTWSHGYAGDVYVAEGQATLSLTLPAGTAAFSFYVQPDAWDLFEFQVSAGGSTSAAFTVDGDAGARYVGLYSTDPGQPLSQVWIENTDGQAGGFAVGEFAIAVVPEPEGSLALGGLGCLALAAWRARRRDQETANPQQPSRST